MSKYNRLWKYVAQKDQVELILSFAQIGQIAGVPLDHSFLRYKKELPKYGYQVEKISLKKKTVCFAKLTKGRNLSGNNQGNEADDV